MKTIFITILCLYSTIFYNQSSREIQGINVLNDRILKTIPGVQGNDYFIIQVDAGTYDYAVVAKSNNDYILYQLLGSINNYTFDIEQSKLIDSKHRLAIDAIFNHFIPKSGVKRYLSEYGIGWDDYVPIDYYFAMFKKGIKAFDMLLPGGNKHNNVEIVHHFDDATLNTIVTIIQ